jgi:hypothetical protein
VPAILLGGGESHHLGRDRTRNRSASSVGNDLWHDLKPSFGDLGEISLACEAETALHGRTLLAGDAEGRRIEFPAGVRPEEWTARPPNELGRRRFLNAGYPSSATPAADTEGKHQGVTTPVNAFGHDGGQLAVARLQVTKIAWRQGSHHQSALRLALLRVQFLAATTRKYNLQSLDYRS